ncbi:LysR family transcriptional regulator [Neptuniibacter halophilus]|uniref:LysR family transcriptional regulator n=1 Tax=Neptuniibacter halophilus TaxID=651666 RepID=UPI00257407AD|nr:LysR family transcriptional regulator [Neptuniibacter halophilus]
MNKINLMQAFICVYEEGSYTAAARRLGKTKALLSTQIAQLEEHLQVRLITRSTRSLKPTSAGRSYYEQARQILDEISNLEARLRDEHHSLQGKLRLSAPTTFGEVVLMPFLAELLQTHPQLEFDLMLSDRYVDIINEGFDAAVRIGQLQDSSLIASQLGEIRMQLCAAPDFLQRYGTPANLQALKSLPCVFDTNYRYSHWAFNTEQGSVQVNPRQKVRVNSALASASMARSGAAICYCPDFAVTALINSGELIPLLADQFDNRTPVQLIYPHRKHLSTRVALLSSELKTYLTGSGFSAENEA